MDPADSEPHLGDAIMVVEVGKTVSLAPLFSMMDHFERQTAALVAAQRQVVVAAPRF